MSTRLTLPHTTHGLGLAWYVLECLNLFSCVCELEMGFATGASLLDSIKLGLKMFEFDGKVGIFVIKVVVAMDLTGKSSVIVDEERIM